MDYEVGVCPECGGMLEYIHCFNKMSCDTCDYEVVEVNCEN